MGNFPLLSHILLNLVAQLAHHLDVVGPGLLVLFLEVEQLSVFLELRRKLIKYELARGLFLSLSSRPLGGYLYSMLLFLGDGDNEQKQIVIHIIGFGKAEKQFLFSILNVVVAVLIVCINQLNYLKPNQFSVYHLVFI